MAVERSGNLATPACDPEELERRKLLIAGLGIPAAMLVATIGGEAAAQDSTRSAASVPQSGHAGIDANDFFAIQNLIHAYADRLDDGDPKGVAKVLGRDPNADPAYFIYPDTGTPHTHHVTTNIMIHPDGPDRATAQSYFTVFQATPSLPLQPIIGGRYHDRFARVNGEWRFAERRIEPRLWGNLTQHLKHAPQPGQPLPQPAPITPTLTGSQ